jgi:hypothetical protein
VEEQQWKSETLLFLVSEGCGAQHQRVQDGFGPKKNEGSVGRKHLTVFMHYGALRVAHALTVDHAFKMH